MENFLLICIFLRYENKSDFIYSIRCILIISNQYTGRILGQQNLFPTPIDTKGFQTVLNLVENTCKDSFDLFFGLYFYNKYASNQLQKIREALAQVERQLAAKEAYLAAKSEVNIDQRNRILEECKSIMREALEEAIVTGKSSMIDSKEPIPPQPTDEKS
jgi:hypothetical protein